MNKKIVCLITVMMILITGGCVTVSPKSEIELLNTQDSTVLSLGGTDALGRTFSHSSPLNEKQVGLFYFLWNGQQPSMMTDIYDAQKLMDTLGVDLFFSPDSAFMGSPYGQFHFWGEPLFGYYNATDTYVMRRHLEMLTMASVDFLVFDTTNLFHFPQVWKPFLEQVQLFLDQGFDVPKIAFYTKNDSVKRVTQIYEELYSKNYYPDTWYSPNGKPLIIAENRVLLSQEIRDFFDFRSSQWPGQTEHEDGFPWIDFSRQQKVYPKGGANGGTIMNVSVSQHANWPFSDSIAYKDAAIAPNTDKTYYNTNWGRGYSTLTGANDISKIDEGINFQQQWDNALAASPDTIFITGWNEWIATKFYEDITISTGVTSRYNLPDRRIFMVDTLNWEFSRDIEPMRGGFGDNYYIQMIENIRTYKGDGGALIPNAQQRTIDINGDISQWEGVTTAFRDFVGDAYRRNHPDAANKSRYIDNSARNDISEVRVSHDNDNIYMLITADTDITDYESGDTNWMNVYIGSDNGETSGFHGFNYIINRNPDSSGNTSVETLSSGFVTGNHGIAVYKVSGKYLQLQIPKAAVGINNQDFSLRLKVTDNITQPQEIMDYYISGDSAPIGRLWYSYYNK